MGKSEIVLTPRTYHRTIRPILILAGRAVNVIQRVITQPIRQTRVALVEDTAGRKCRIAAGAGLVVPVRTRIAGRVVALCRDTR